MTEMLVTVLAEIVYAGSISVGWGKRMDDHIVTRPLVVAGGVLIVIIGYAWSHATLDLFLDLLVWFTLAVIPLFVRSAILHFKQEDADARQREQEEVEQYTVKGVGKR